ncbi:MAG: hypothetical protein ACON5B_16480 [Myxococcota bacterium]
MSDTTGVTEAQVEELLGAAFGGAVPDAVRSLLDVPLCAKLIDDAKLGFVFSLTGAEAPRIRLAKDEEAEAFSEKLAAVWPASAGFLAEFPEAEWIAETEGTTLRLFAIFDEPSGIHEGAQVMGHVLHLPGGERDTVTLFDQAPLDAVNEAQRGGVAPLVDAGAEGQWMGAWRGSILESVFWITEQPFRVESSQRVVDLGGGERLTALRDAVADKGRNIDPYMVDWRADGTVDVCAWGIRTRGVAEADMPEVLQDGAVPDAEAFAVLLARAMPEGDVEAAHRLVAESMYGARLVFDGGNPSGTLQGFWQFIMGRLVEVGPGERLAALQDSARALEVALLQRRAGHLAVARYLADHPDTTLEDLPEDSVEVPDADVLAMTVEQLKADATAGLEALTAHEAWMGGLVDVLATYEDGIHIDVPAIRDQLERAASGDFTEATGYLHDVLMAFGPGGYDDDPSMASLDDIDLEADAREAAIEEALAMDDDDDDF